MSDVMLSSRDVRLGGNRFLGVPVGDSVAPVDLDEAGEALREAASHRYTVAFLGGGTELGLGYVPTRVDVLVRTTGLTRIVEYASSDMTVTVEAGLTLAALQERLRAEGQRLALDPPLPALATVGGLLATNAFGPRRARFGSMRDLIVGVSLIRADGTRVRGGGKVVKNVAGFDLPKLMAGALGTLGMIATVTFRLHPLPEASRLLRVTGCDAAALRGLRKSSVAAQLEPAATLAVRTGGAYDLYALFEGFEAGVAEQAARFALVAEATGAFADTLEEAERLTELDREARTYGSVRLRLAAPPAALETLDRTALDPLEAAFGDARTVLYPALGIAFVSGVPRDPGAAVAALGEARSALERLGGNLVVTEPGDDPLIRGLDPFGTLPASFALMRNLKDRFDPEHRLNGGRFLGGL
ncbi:MAG: FAD-binding oxidoreductase [Vulcanimicrobiaceae bacterium]